MSIPTPEEAPVPRTVHIARRAASALGAIAGGFLVMILGAVVLARPARISSVVVAVLLLVAVGLDVL